MVEGTSGRQTCRVWIPRATNHVISYVPVLDTIIIPSSQGFCDLKWADMLEAIKGCLGFTKCPINASSHHHLFNENTEVVRTERNYAMTLGESAHKKQCIVYSWFCRLFKSLKIANILTNIKYLMPRGFSFFLLNCTILTFRVHIPSDWTHLRRKEVFTSNTISLSTKFI